jgi:hypothetical protein
MDELRKLRPVAYDYLMDEKAHPRSLWTNHAFPMRHWNSQTNNLAERGINWVGEAARQKAPVSFLKQFCQKHMEQQYERLQEALELKRNNVSDLCYCF